MPLQDPEATKIALQAHKLTMRPPLVFKAGDDADGDGDADDGKDKEPETDKLVTGVLTEKQLKVYTGDGLFVTEFADRISALIKVFVSEVGQVARDRKAYEAEELIRIKPRIVKACRKKYPKTELLFENWEMAAKKTFKITAADIRNKDRKPRKYEDIPPPEEDKEDNDTVKDDKSRSKKPGDDVSVQDD